MSLVTKSIGLAKKVKHRFQNQVRAHTPVYLSPVRRIEQVAIQERVCAMTFDDGPCRLPPRPDKTGGHPLTLVLADILERYGAKGTFDVVGDTSGNYPDTPGKEGSASWGGVRYDHYPDYGQDNQGGAANCPDIIKRLLDGGHEISSHTYAHVLFGFKPLVYGQRRYLTGLQPVIDDLEKLHRLFQEQWGYTIRLGRPPHYVDRIRGGFSSYDAYALLGYQYMASSYDGAGWLPLDGGYEAETEVMWKPMETLLNANPEALRGQIIFQKDGYNMARRSPVVDGLEKQLQLLTSHGYTVVTVSDLLTRSPFRDVLPDSPVGTAARQLLIAGWTTAFRDNCVKPDTPLTRGALAMMAYGWEAVPQRIELIKARHLAFADMNGNHPYAAAALLAVENRVMAAPDGKFRPQEPASAQDVASVCATKLGKTPSWENFREITHGEFLLKAAEQLSQ